jgi:hypothetical protein
MLASARACWLRSNYRADQFSLRAANG